MFRNTLFILKTFCFLFVSILCVKLLSQGSAAFFDDRKFFYTYQNGNIQQQEIIPIDTFVSGYHYVAYINRMGQFKLIHNQKKYTIFPVPPTIFKTSNSMIAYTMGGQLGVFNGRQSKTIAPFTTGEFALSDSMLVYIDNFGKLNAYIIDSTIEVMTFANQNNYKLGDNILGFHTLDQKLRALYKKEIVEIESYHEGRYEVVKDMIVYHDYLSNFKVWDHGSIQLLEPYEVLNFELSNEILSYRAPSNEWYVYSYGEKTLLLNTKPKKTWQKRNILAYSDNAGNFFVFYKGKKQQLENFEPSRVEIWDDILVYPDLNNILWGYVHGQKIQISDAIVKEWWIQNQCIVFWDLTPNIKAVWNKGKVHRYVANDYMDK